MWHQILYNIYKDLDEKYSKSMLSAMQLKDGLKQSEPTCVDVLLEETNINGLMLPEFVS